MAGRPAPTALRRSVSQLTPSAAQSGRHPDDVGVPQDLILLANSTFEKAARPGRRSRRAGASQPRVDDVATRRRAGYDEVTSQKNTRVSPPARPSNPWTRLRTPQMISRW